MEAGSGDNWKGLSPKSAKGEKYCGGICYSGGREDSKASCRREEQVSKLRGRVQKNSKRGFETVRGKEKSAGRIWDKDQIIYALSKGLFGGISFVEVVGKRYYYGGNGERG